MADLPLMLPEYEPDPTRWARDYQQTPVGWDEFLGAAGDIAVFENPVESIGRSLQLDRARLQGRRVIRRPDGLLGIENDPETMMTPDEWRNSNLYRPSLEVTAPIKRRVAELNAQFHDEEAALRDIYDRGPDGFLAGAAGFGVQLAYSFTDPINIAASFIPVLGPARYAAMAQRIGTVGARAVGGAFEGAVGTAALEPLLYGLAQHQQRQYSIEDSLLNVAFGAVAGGTFNVAGRAALDYAGRLRNSRSPAVREVLQVLNESAPGTHEAVIRSTIADLVEGRPVNVAPVLGNDPRIGGIVRATPREFEQLQRTIADIDTGRIPTRRELQRVLSETEFEQFRLRDQQIRQEATERLVPVRSEAAEAYTEAARQARRARTQAKTPAQVERAQRAQERAQKLFQRLPEQDRAAFTQVDGDPLPRRRTQRVTREQARAQAAREVLETGIERRLQELEQGTPGPRVTPEQAAERPIAAQLARERRAPLTQEETIALINEQRQAPDPDVELVQLEQPTPIRSTVQSVQEIEQELQAIQADLESLARVAPERIDQDLVAEIQDVDAELNRHEGADEAVMAGFLCLSKANG